MNKSGTIKGKVFSGRVIFDHRPKTGGTAVTDWLQESLGDGCVAHVVGDTHRGMIGRHGGNYSVLCGHVQFFRGGESLDPRYQYITCLRDPVDRALSWIYFSSNNIAFDFVYGPNGRFDTKELAKAFIKSEGRDHTERFLNSISNVYTNHFRKVRTAAGEMSSDPVIKAYEAIKTYDVVGLHENMPGFIGDVSRLLDIASPATLERKNVTKGRPSKDNAAHALKERLKELNQQDLRLFDMVREWKLSQPGAGADKEGKKEWISYKKPPPAATTDGVSIRTGAVRSGMGVYAGQNIEIDFDFELSREVKELVASVSIYDSFETLAFGTDNVKTGNRLKRLSKGSYRVTFSLKADLPSGYYWAGLSLHERISGEKNPVFLGRHDNLCYFKVAHVAPHVYEGYSFLAGSVSLTASGDARFVMREGNGKIRLAGPMATLTASGEIKIPVKITNNSSQDWLGDKARPIHISYHLLDNEGKPVVFNGLRSPFPANGIAAGNTVDAVMRVAAPVPPGKYKLAPSLVQENVCWFEQIGFVPEPLDVEVA